jgi:hypothetical protein
LNVQHRVSELIETLAVTYGAIDIRSVAIRNDDSRVGALYVVRLTYETVDEAQARLQKLARLFPAVKTKLLRIDSIIRPFSEWAEFCTEVEKGVLRVGECDVIMRARPDVKEPSGYNLRESSGYLQSGHFGMRAFDGLDWPTLCLNLGPVGANPLIENRLTRDAQLLGYSDTFEPINRLCELNVSLSQPGGCAFYLSVPAFATVSRLSVNLSEKRVIATISRHNALPDLMAFAGLRGYTAAAGDPLRVQLQVPIVTEKKEGKLLIATASTQFESLDIDDWIRVRLVHPEIGEIKQTENYARLLISPAERNILLEALKRFCGDSELENLLVEPHNVKAPRLNESAAFELHVSWLLGLYGFSTLVLGNYEHIVAPNTKVQMASVDILAAKQPDRVLLLVACTLNPAKPEDFGNLRYARAILARETFAGTAVNIIPVLFTAATGGASIDTTDDLLDPVRTVDGDDMLRLLELLGEGQEARFLQFLGNPTLSSL